MMRKTLVTEKKSMVVVALGALGMVFGDIGTSPLYAMRESLRGLPIVPENVLGVLSLIFWSLILVISVKYLIFILRADNDGEGGVLALLALLKRGNKNSYKLLFLVGVAGAGLLLGDGMLTPAISVLSAIEGLKVVSPTVSHFIVPLTCIILITLFSLQSIGTENIGRLFGPILLFWFITIGILGLINIQLNSHVLAAINPRYAWDFFTHNGWQGYFELGGVFLVVTGGEALYADLGHFGRVPIRLAWFTIALPGLMLNYFGQGAYLLTYPEAIVNPFYALAPSWFLVPLILIATIATIVASQAVITATFSLAKQAILLDLLPRLNIIQTSAHTRGQIYVPQMNTILAIGTLILVITFKNSSALAHAYGIAVNLVMLGEIVMVICVARIHWHWSYLKILLLFSIFFIIDISFLGANLHKILTGGWVPLLFATIVVIIMVTWKKGMSYLRSEYYREKVDLKTIVKEFDHPRIRHLPKMTTVFIADPYDQGGGALLHYFKLNRMLPEHILIVSIAVGSHPYKKVKDRYELINLGHGILRLNLHYGFMDTINVPRALSTANQRELLPFKLDIEDATFLVEIAQVHATRKKKTLFFFWQEKLFAYLMRNAVLDIEFYHLPLNRSIAIGAYCEI